MAGILRASVTRHLASLADSAFLHGQSALLCLRMADRRRLLPVRSRRRPVHSVGPGIAIGHRVAVGGGTAEGAERRSESSHPGSGHPHSARCGFVDRAIDHQTDSGPIVTGLKCPERMLLRSSAGFIRFQNKQQG